MRDETKRETWTEYFKGFSKRNQARSAYLEVFGEIGKRAGLPSTAAIANIAPLRRMREIKTRNTLFNL
jgi:hypothetical protein